MRSLRENNYELLRIICTIAVISIHVCAAKIICINTENYHYIFNGLSRFAVPCFIMLSGAFILANDKNQDYKYFYKKSFKKIEIPTIIFTLFYVYFKLSTSFDYISNEKFSEVAIIFFVTACISGGTSTHKLSWDI